jgi:hypothetical protein
MKRKRHLFSGLLAILGAALVVFVLAWRSAEASRDRLQALARERSRAAGEIGRMRQAIGRHENASASLRQELDAALADSGSAPEGVDPRARAAAVRREIRAWADLRYARLFKVLGLSAQQIAAFDDLVTSHQLAMHDLAEAAANGVPPTDSTVAQLLRQESDQFHARESDLLGGPGYQQLQEDLRTAEPRGWVNSLAGNLFASDPLSAQQEDSLVQILAQQSAGYQAGSGAELGQIPDWEPVFSRAAGILTPAQLEAMRSLRATFPAGIRAMRVAAGAPPQ